jgi:hypothetical protein
MTEITITIAVVVGVLLEIALVWGVWRIDRRAQRVEDRDRPATASDIDAARRRLGIAARIAGQRNDQDPPPTIAAASRQAEILARRR